MFLARGTPNVKYFIPIESIKRDPPFVVQNLGNQIEIKVTKITEINGHEVSREVEVTKKNPEQIIPTLCQDRIIYKDIIVECEYCKGKFSWKKLEELHDWEYIAKDICPICKFSYCCELEFERVHEYAKKIQ